MSLKKTIEKYGINTIKQTSTQCRNVVFTLWKKHKSS